jgi:hypothetical protein
MAPAGNVAWRAEAARIAGAAVIGAVIGWAISWDLDWSVAAGQRECAHASGLCLGFAPIAGLAGGLLVAVLECWAGFAVTGLRPLAVTVPSAVAVLPEVPGYRIQSAYAQDGALALNTAARTGTRFGLPTLTEALSTLRPTSAVALTAGNR